MANHFCRYFIGRQYLVDPEPHPRTTVSLGQLECTRLVERDRLGVRLLPLAMVFEQVMLCRRVR